jgi:hypothetical protein
VTNAEFKKFLDATHYHPKDSLNFLKDWKDGSYPDGWANKPVTWVSIEDAREYANGQGNGFLTSGSGSTPRKATMDALSLGELRLAAPRRLAAQPQGQAGSDSAARNSAWLPFGQQSSNGAGADSG